MRYLAMFCKNKGRPEAAGGEGVEREQTTVRMPKELKDQLIQGANECGKSLTDFIEMLLRAWVKIYQSE